MICPVCEHQQEFGIECEVCGKDLGGLGALGPPPVAAERVEGLEVTVPDPVGEIPVERVAELEVTHHSPVNVAVERFADVEVTSAPAVGEVAVEPVELTPDRAPDDGVRTAAPTGAVTCRYCRNVQAEGLICERCGMRLPRLPLVEAAAPGVPASKQLVRVRCKMCGAPATPGSRCSECGREVPLPE